MNSAIKFRRTETSDLPTIGKWIEQDPPHAHIDPDFFVSSPRGVSCYTIEDHEGPVIFVRQESADEITRLHTQFPPDRKRVARAIQAAYPIVQRDAARRGFRRIAFTSQSVALIRFMLRFGFHAELEKDL